MLVGLDRNTNHTKYCTNRVSHRAPKISKTNLTNTRINLHHQTQTLLGYKKVPMKRYPRAKPMNPTLLTTEPAPELFGEEAGFIVVSLVLPLPEWAFDGGGAEAGAFAPNKS